MRHAFARLPARPALPVLSYAHYDALPASHHHAITSLMKMSGFPLHRRADVAI